MHGYQITFYMEQNRRHRGQPLGEWLLQLAQELQLQGATLQAAAAGFGRSGHFHSAHFVELGDQPLTLVTVVTEEEAQRLLARLREEQLQLFHVKIAADFGVLA